jgi:hypothetical protein
LDSSSETRTKMITNVPKGSSLSTRTAFKINFAAWKKNLDESF